MKIALCLHGLFNSTTDQTSNGFDGFNYIKKHILDKSDVDVYIHSWELDKKDEIIALYNPNDYIFQPQKLFSKIILDRGLNTLTNTPRPISSVISHLYSVTESIKLALNSKHDYDIIIKSRFDLGRINRNTSGPNKHNPFPVQCINFNTDLSNSIAFYKYWMIKNGLWDNKILLNTTWE
jgi:hypothetical protein